MKLHPAVSVILGIVAFIILYVISILLINIGSNVVLITLILSFIIGGFITVYFGIGKKIQYVLYELILVIIFLFYLNQGFSILLALIFMPLGGLLAKIRYKDI